MVRHVPPRSWLREPGQTSGMERAIAISRATVGSGGVYSSVVTTPPGGATRVHHHGPCETSIYIVSGRARFTWGPSGIEESLEADAGDFVYIPAGELHVEENASSSDELVVVVTRNCDDAVTIFP